MNVTFKVVDKAPKLVAGFYITKETGDGITYNLGTALTTFFTAVLHFSSTDNGFNAELIIDIKSDMPAAINIFTESVKKAFMTVDSQCQIREEI